MAGVICEIAISVRPAEGRLWVDLRRSFCRYRTLFSASWGGRSRGRFDRSITTGMCSGADQQQQRTTALIATLARSMPVFSPMRVEQPQKLFAQFGDVQHVLCARHGHVQQAHLVLV